MFDVKLKMNENNHAEFLYLRCVAPQLDAAARGTGAGGGSEK